LNCYAGESWVINVAKLAFKNKLFEGNGAFVGTQKATREEAALYVLNTLLAPTYTYATKGTNITTEGGATINIGASAPAAGQTFMAQYYSNLKVNNGNDRTYLGNGTDDFGRASNNWTYKGAEIGKYAIFFPSTSPVASTTLKNTATGKNETFPVYVGYINGVQTMIPTKTAPAAAGTYYAYAKNDNVPGAIVLGSAPYTVTTGTTSTFGGQVISAFDDKLVTLHTTVPSAATMPNIDISGATIVDVRTDADKDSKPVVLTAAGLCDAINYNLKLSVVFNADTGKASLVYVCSRDVAYTNAFTSTANVSVAGGGVYSVSIDKASASAGQTITVTYTVVTVCPATSDKLVLTGAGIGVTTPAAGTGVVFTSSASVGDTATVTYVMPAANVTDLAVTGTHT